MKTRDKAVGLLCYIVAILAVVCSIQPVSAQEIVINKPNISPGIVSNNVRSIAQDDLGYVWFGCVSGIYRYDGYFFNAFQTSETNETSLLSSRHIGKIQKWKDGLMIIMPQDGNLCLFDVYKNRFVPISEKEATVRCTKFRVDEQSRLWLWRDSDNVTQLSCKEGVISRKELTDDDYTIRRIPNDCDLLKKIIKGEAPFDKFNIKRSKHEIARIITGVAQSKDVIFIFTNTTTYEYNLKTHKTSASTTLQIPMAGVIRDNIGNDVVMDDEISLWHINKKTGKVIKIDVFDQHLKKIATSRKFCVATFEDSGIICVSTYGNGLTLHNTTTGETIPVKTRFGRFPDLLNTNYIVDMEVDNAGNIWISEEYYGLKCFSLNRKDKTQFLLRDKDSDVHDNRINFIRRLDDNNIYIGSKDVIYRSNGDLTAMTPITTIRDLRDICMDASGRLWVSTFRNGLYVDGRCYLPGTSQYQMMKDRKNRMWITMDHGGLLMATETQNKGITFKHFFGNKTLRAIIQDKKGDIWVGGTDGVYRFSPEELIKHPDRYESLGIKDGIMCLYEDRKQRMWIGTFNRGVYYSSSFDKLGNQSSKVHSSTNSGTEFKGSRVQEFKSSRGSRDQEIAFETLNSCNGLINDGICSFAETNNSDNILISTVQGITVFNPDRKETRPFYISSIIDQNSYLLNTIITDDLQRLIMGTMEGVMVWEGITETDDAGNHDSKKLVVSDLLVNGISIIDQYGKSVLDNALCTMDKIVLEHNQNFLTFHFSTFNFTDPSETKYSYKLENYDKNWSEMSVNSSAVYKNLSPGRYTLRIRAFENNVLGELEKTIEIVINPPLWLRWWAILIYIILLTLCGWYVWKQVSTIYRLRQNIAMEKKLSEYKAVFFTNISHEFRTPLTIIKGGIDNIMGQKDIPANMRQPISNISKGTSRMMRLINQLLEFRKMQWGKLQLSLEETEVVGFLRDLGQTFSDVVESKQMNYIFKTSEKEHRMFIDRDYIDKTVYNLLSNAFKYTPAGGTVCLRCYTDNDKFIIQVSDTGIGVAEEKRSQLFHRYVQSEFVSDSIGIGLNLAYELIKTHHGDITYNENPDGGSLFTVTLPDDISLYNETDFLKKSELNTQKTESPEVYKELAPLPYNDKTVLIVEDDAELLNYTASIIKRYFNVAIAGNGKEALEVISSKKPDLILSDIMMNEMSGLQLTEKIRSNAQLSNIPIVLLTALTGDENQLKAIRKGADAFITKPFNTDILLATITNLIERRTKVQQAQSAPSAPEKALITSEKDKKFIDHISIWLESRLSNPDISVDEWAADMELGRTSFYNKMKKITGMTPNDYIRHYKLTKAHEMLTNDNKSVSEVMYATGFSSSSYFAKCFKNKFGYLPSSI